MCTIAQFGGYDWTRASFGPPKSTTQTANRSVQHFLHSLRQKVRILYNGRPFPPKLPLAIPGSGPHLIHDSLGHSKITIQTAWRSIQPFSHKWPQSVPIPYYGCPFPPKLPLPMGDLDPHLTQITAVSLYFTMGRPFSLKIAPSHAGSGPHLIHGSLGPRVLNPTGISTDCYLVGNNRPHLHM